jgi:hypothetical protein
VRESFQGQLEGEGLRVRFVVQGDRVAHEISLLGDDRWQVVLSTVEGDPTQDWPPSPPWQSLHIERPPDEPARALLVGMAGRSHWSASVLLDSSPPRLRFDIACRVRPGPAGRLGVVYRSAWPLVSHDARHALWQTSPARDAQALRLELDDHDLATRLEPTPEGIAIIPQDQAATAAGRTIRWTYTVR